MKNKEYTKEEIEKVEKIDFYDFAGIDALWMTFQDKVGCLKYYGIILTEEEKNKLIK